jgi:hypothetical protein
MGLSDIVILICLLVSITAFFRRNTPIYLKVLSCMLILTVAAEIIAYWQVSHKHTNARTYNISTSLWAMMAAYIFYEIIYFKAVKTIIRIFWVSYPILIFFNIRYLQEVDSFLTNTYALGSLMIVFLSIAYFYELFHRTQSINLLREPAFWISTGLLFYNTTSLPFFAMIYYLAEKSSSTTSDLYTIILSFSNVLEYSMFIIAFLCKIPIRRYISSLL